jgi:hypothetical protein
MSLAWVEADILRCGRCRRTPLDHARTAVHGGGGGGGHDAGGGRDAGSGKSADLTFAIVGDTRPSSIDDTSNYPTSIITKIYEDIEGASPKPTFVVGTGDYQYASTTGSEQAPQIDKYMTARAVFTGRFYPAMGNHECTGYTDSNCGSGESDGITKNYTTFMTTMLGPISETNPYYVEKVSASDGSWTAKLVFVACNARHRRRRQPQRERNAHRDDVRLLVAVGDRHVHDSGIRCCRVAVERSRRASAQVVDACGMSTRLIIIHLR